jgi:hypothetical protein
MQTDWATIEINGAQRIIHRRPCCRGGDGLREGYCSKERPTDSCCQRGTRTVRLGGHIQSECPSGRPENPRQSFHS